VKLSLSVRSGSPSDDLSTLIRCELDVDRALFANDFDVFIAVGDSAETHGAIDDDHGCILQSLQPLPQGF
jgi:hypothetical protein